MHSSRSRRRIPIAPSGCIESDAVGSGCSQRAKGKTRCQRRSLSPDGNRAVNPMLSHPATRRPATWQRQRSGCPRASLRRDWVCWTSATDATSRRRRCMRAWSRLPRSRCGPWMNWPRSSRGCLGWTKSFGKKLGALSKPSAGRRRFVRGNPLGTALQRRGSSGRPFSLRRRRASLQSQRPARS